MDEDLGESSIRHITVHFWGTQSKPAIMHEFATKLRKSGKSQRILMHEIHF